MTEISLDDIELLISDWNGTGLKDDDAIYSATKRILQLHGMEMQFTKEEWLQQPVVTNTVEGLRRYGLEGTDVQVQQYRAFYGAFRKTSAPARLVSGMKETAQYLHRKRKGLAILSTQNLNGLTEDLREFGLHRYFSVVLGDSHDKVEGLEKICSVFGVRPDRALYMDDIAYGVRCGRTAGLRTAGAEWGYDKPENLARENPDIILRRDWFELGWYQPFSTS